MVYFFHRNRPEYYQTPFGYTPIVERSHDISPDVEAFIVPDSTTVYDEKGKVVI